MLRITPDPSFHVGRLSRAARPKAAQFAYSLKIGLNCAALRAERLWRAASHEKIAIGPSGIMRNYL